MMSASSSRGGSSRTAQAMLGLSLLLGSLAASAEDIPLLLARKHCDACHDVNSALIGPSYVAIATRYKADRDAMAVVLARKILIGGGGNWGVVPMVPNEHVTLDEARAIVRWILDLETAAPSG